MRLPETVHASAVLIGTDGVLIRGKPGSGKSSLVLAILYGTKPAWLIADDRVQLSDRTGRLLASAPEALAGKLEIRGQGIVTRDHVSPAAVGLVVDLLPLADCPRLPEEAEMRVTILGITLPRLMLPVGSADGPIRVYAALDRVGIAAPA